MDRLHLQVPTERVVSDHIDERSLRSRDADAVDGFHILLAEPSAVESQDRWNGGHALKAGRHGHVQSSGHHVREFVQAQGSRVAERSLRLPVAIVRPELPEHQVWPSTRGELRQPVDPSALADPVTGSDVIGVDVVLEPGFARLAGSEVASLSLR